MIKKIIFLILVFAPFLVLAAESPVATEPAQAAQAAQSGQGIQAAADVASNFIEDIWSFFDDDLPDFFKRALVYILEKITLFKISAQIEAMKLAWSVSKSVIESFQIGSKLASAASALPQDVKGALVDMRLFDGLNIIIQAFIARYILRFI